MNKFRKNSHSNYQKEFKTSSMPAGTEITSNARNFRKCQISQSHQKKQASSSKHNSTHQKPQKKQKGAFMHYSTPQPISLMSLIDSTWINNKISCSTRHKSSNPPSTIKQIKSSSASAKLYRASIRSGTSKKQQINPLASSQ